jgi:hypothetical protein
LGESGHHQPRPPVGLLGMAHSRCVVHPNVCLRKRKVCSKSKRLMYARQRTSRSGSSSPGPSHHNHSFFGSRRLSPRGNRSTSTNTRASRPRWAKVHGCRDLHVRRPSDASFPRRALAPSRSQRVYACVLRRGLGPGTRVRALHLRPVTTRPAGMGGWALPFGSAAAFQGGNGAAPK